jgi:hypothetical protein
MVPIGGTIQQRLFRVQMDVSGSRADTVVTQLYSIRQQLTAGMEAFGVIHTDLSGNKLTVSSNGIVSARGPVVQILFRLRQSVNALNGAMYGPIRQTLFKPKQSFVAKVSSTGPIAQTLGRIRQLSTGVAPMQGQIAELLFKLRQAATGKEVMIGDIADSLAGLYQTAPGISGSGGEILMLLGSLDQQLTAAVNTIGPVVQILQQARQQAFADVSSTGPIAQRLLGPVQNATGWEEIFAHGAQRLFRPTQVAYGSPSGAITQRLFHPVQSLTAFDMTVTAAAAQQLLKATQHLTGAEESFGPVQQNLSRIMQHAVAEELPIGGVVQTLPSRIMQHAVGLWEFDAAVVSIIPPVFQRAQGVYIAFAYGQQMLFSPAQSAQGWGSIAGSAGMRLPGAIMQGGGLAPFAGTASQRLFVPMQTLAGWEEIFAHGAQTLFKPTQLIAASRGASGTAAQTLFRMAQRSDGFVTPVGSVSQLLGGISQGTLGSVVLGLLEPSNLIPQGRLTLSSGVPFMTTDVGGATTVYYTPAVGNYIPVWNGTTFTPNTFTETSQTLSDITKSPPNIVGGGTLANLNYDLFVWVDGGTVRCTRGPRWGSDTVRGTGANTSQLHMVQGIYVNQFDIVNGPAAGYGVYVGTIRTDPSNQLDQMLYPTPAAGGGNNLLCVWNMYNRRQITSTNVDSTATWTYSTETWRVKNNSNANSISFIVGMVEDCISAKNQGKVKPGSAAGGATGIGYNSNTVCLDGAEFFSFPVSGLWMSSMSRAELMPRLGWSALVPLEISISGNSIQWFGSSTATGAHIFSNQAFTATITM